MYRGGRREDDLSDFGDDVEMGGGGLRLFCIHSPMMVGSMA